MDFHGHPDREGLKHAESSGLADSDFDMDNTAFEHHLRQTWTKKMIITYCILKGVMPYSSSILYSRLR